MSRTLGTQYAARRAHAGSRCSGRPTYRGATTAVFALLLHVGGCGPCGPGPSGDPSTAGVGGNLPGADAGAGERPLSAAAYPVVVWAGRTVERLFFDPARIDPQRQLEVALGRLSVRWPEAAFEWEGATLRVTVRERTVRVVAVPTLDRLEDAAWVLDDVLAALAEGLAPAGEEAWRLVYDATNALLVALDPHTVLLPPEAFAELTVRTRGTFGGVGVRLARHRGRLRVAATLPGGPADRAGIRPGDLLWTIAGRSTAGMTAKDARRLLRGPVGEAVTLSVRRGGGFQRFTVVRETIHVPDVAGAKVAGTQVGLVRVAAFQEGTARRARETIEALRAKGAEALVLDLRGNEGGLLVEATRLLDGFVADGDLVRVHSVAGVEAMPASAERLVPPHVPVVVLVDETSASASEVLAGGLSAHGRAVVAGRNTFGKGTVQRLLPMETAGRKMGMKVTVAAYRTHGGREIEMVGVVPDVRLNPVRLAEQGRLVTFYDRERFERRRQRGRLRGLPVFRRSSGGPPVSPWVVDLLARETVSGNEDVWVGVRLDDEAKVAVQLAERLRTVELREAAAAVAAREQAEIEGELARRGVDFRPEVPAPSPPDLEVTAVVRPAGAVPAGGRGTLSVRVRHRSGPPAGRLHLRTESEKPELDALEALIGRLEAGQERTVVLPFAVPVRRAPYRDRVRVRVERDRDPEPLAETAASVRVASRRLPKYALEVFVVDEPGLAAKPVWRPWVRRAQAEEESFTVRGNGDGALGPGESVLLALCARNRGTVSAPGVVAAIRPRTGPAAVFTSSAARVGDLAPGARGCGAVGLAVASDTGSSGVPEGDRRVLTFDARIEDETFGQGFFHTVSVPVLVPRGSFRGTAGSAMANEPVRVLDHAHPQARVLAEVPAGGRFPVEGRVGSYLVVPLAHPGRRGFVPEDLVRLLPGAGGTRPRPMSSLVPPDIVVSAPEAVPAKTKAVIDVRLGGKTPVADVYLLAGGTPRAPWKEKRDYRSLRRAGRDAGGPSLRFEVPVGPGSTRFEVVARSPGGVAARQAVWIYGTPSSLP